MNRSTPSDPHGVRAPIVIIGAPRSGTNMLRDVLTTLPGVGSWPCDEINYLWRRGNANWPTDELTPAHVSASSRRAIHIAFQRLARRESLDHVVEKTCANSLRVPFVQAILPDAKFIFLVRDGRDAIASTMQCWTRRPELGYLLKKARYVPPSDLPFYAAKFFRSQLSRFTTQEKRWASWGPRFTGMDAMLREKSLAEVCAAQWAACVVHSAAAMRNVPLENRHPLHYEHFVSQPRKALARIVQQFDIDATPQQLAAATNQVSSRSVGKWRQSVDAETMDHATRNLTPLLEQFGYGNSTTASASQQVA